MTEAYSVQCTKAIGRYTQGGFSYEALKLFRQMQSACLKPNHVAFTSVLIACAKLELLHHGLSMHALILKGQIKSDVSVFNTLITMYYKCQRLNDAVRVFERIPNRDLVSWNAIIAAYAQNGQFAEAIDHYSHLQHEGFKPDSRTFTSVVSLCSLPEAIEQGQQDIVQNAFGVEALELFCTMRKKEIDPDEFTFSSILTACASLSFEIGKQVHVHVKKFGKEWVVMVGNALVNMYAKCGSIDDAKEIFEKMLDRNSSSWNSMILASAEHGQGKDAIELFEQMQRTQTEPDHITFLGVLHACCHKGLVAEVHSYFQLMSRGHGIIAREEHYACMVDLLGCAGQLIEAEDFINSMPFKPGIMVWQTLLGACKSCGNIESGIHTAEQLLSLDPEDAATSVLLSNIYAAAGRWDDRARVRKMMKDREVRKEVGCSWIEVNNKMHTYVFDSR